MARGNQQITNFTAGELDPDLLGRTDLKNYFNAAEKLRNVLVVPQGGAERRAGTLFKDVGRFVTVQRWRFDTTIEGWFGFNSTLSVSNGVLLHPSDAANAAILSPTGLAIDGTANQFVRMKVKRTAGSEWRGQLFWAIDSDPLEFTKFVQVSEPAGLDTDFVIVTWDMSNVTGTGDDWIGNTIGRIQFSLGSLSTADTDFEIDWIEIGTGTPSDTRLINFEFSTDEHYLFELYHEGAKIYKNGAEVADIALPYASSELRALYDSDGNLTQSGVTWSQSYDTLLLFHEDYPIKRVQRQGSDTAWLVDDWPVKNIPFFDFGDDYTIPLSATGSTPNGTGANAANLVDNDDSTTATNSPGDMTSDPLEDRIIFQIDLGSVQTIESVRAVDLRHISGGISDQTFVWSDDGVTWTEFGDVLSTTASDQDFTATATLETRYIGIAAEATNFGVAQLGCDGLNAFSGRVGVDQQVLLDFDQTSWDQQDETFSLSLEGEQTDPIDYQEGSDLGVDNLAAAIQAALRKLPNTSDDGITAVRTDTADVQITVTFGGDDGSRPWPAIEWEVEAGDGGESISVQITVDGQRPGERTWSNARGWPRCGTFHQGRLIAAGTKTRPSTVWLSRAGDFSDFNNQRTTDDYGIEATADTDQVANIFAVNAGRHLQFFTSSAEFYVPSSDTEPITPKNFALRRSTQRGCLAGLPVFDVDGAAMFAQRGGKTLREFIFTDTELAYQSNNISLLSSHLMRVPNSMAYKKAEDTKAADYILMVNDTDGTLTAYCTLRTQEINAFTLQETMGTYHDIQVDLNDIYQVVERSHTGAAVRYLELWDERMRFDCGAADFDVSVPITTITGLEHLNGATVGFIVDDVLQTTTAVVSGGAVNLPVQASSSWQLGIPFKNVSEDSETREYWIRLLPPELNLQDGPVFGKKYRNQAITLRVKDTTGVKVNDERMPLDEIGNTIADQAAAPYTGDLRMRGFGGWGFNENFDISDDRAGNLKLLAVLGKVAV